MARLCWRIMSQLNMIKNAFSYEDFAEDIVCDHLKTCSLCDVTESDRLKPLLGIQETVV